MDHSLGPKHVGSARFLRLIPFTMLSVSVLTCRAEPVVTVDVRGMPAAHTAYSQVLVAHDSVLDGVFRRNCPRVLAIAESALVDLAPDSLAATIGSREADRACGTNIVGCWLGVNVHYGLAWEYAEGRLDRDDVPEAFDGIVKTARRLRAEVGVMLRKGVDSLLRVTTSILADSARAVSRNAGPLGSDGRLVLTGVRPGDGLIVLVQDSNRANGARVHIRPEDSVLVTPYDTLTFDLIAPCRRPKAIKS